LKFNQDKITKLTSEILKAVQRLEELKNLSKEEFLSDHHKIGSAKYHLLIAVEGAVDLCNHIIAKNAFRTPENYADTFKVMVENGAFEQDFLETLTKMARFRNRLVHIYWEVDNNEIYNIIQTRLTDIHKFLKAFSVFIGL
jgi:uncharacterized protein YutE (UPF0331/DUF86 family)